MPAPSSRPRLVAPALAIVALLLAYIVSRTSPFLFGTTLPTTTASFLQQQPLAQSSSINMADKLSFLDAIANRRTIYALQKSSKIPDARIKEIVEQAVTNVPSSFNAQSTRLIVLLKGEHDKFWDVVTTILKAHVPEDKWEHTQQRMDMFSGAYGTILFYEDPEPTKQLQAKFPSYADKFPTWEEHTSAMHQYTLWTAFEAEGLGANLQHYNPLPDQKVTEIWGVPPLWSLKAQLVFGDPKEGAREGLQVKAVQPVDERVKFYGA